MGVYVSIVDRSTQERCLRGSRSITGAVASSGDPIMAQVAVAEYKISRTTKSKIFPINFTMDYVGSENFNLELPVTMAVALADGFGTSRFLPLY